MYSIRIHEGNVEYALSGTSSTNGKVTYDVSLTFPIEGCRVAIVDKRDHCLGIYYTVGSVLPNETCAGLLTAGLPSCRLRSPCCCRENPTEERELIIRFERSHHVHFNSWCKVLGPHMESEQRALKQDGARLDTSKDGHPLLKRLM